MSLRFPPSGVLACFAACLILPSGCGDPIYEQVEAIVSDGDFDGDIEWVASRDASSYEWPLSDRGFFVSEPPKMEFTSSFDRKLAVPDRVNAEVVPWSTEGLDESAQQFLSDAYEPVPGPLKAKLEIASGELTGSQAFDLSIDGTRLAVINQNDLRIYDADDASLIQTVSLSSWFPQTKTQPDAVRFCGSSQDVLVASVETIARISIDDGTLIAKTNGIEEPIKSWDVTNDDQSMLVLGTSGKLYGGDTQLDYFSAYDFGDSKSFESAALSWDGRRICVCFDHKPMTYVQDPETYQIVDLRIDVNVALDEGVSIASGPRGDLWIDGDGALVQYRNQNDAPVHSLYHMFWQPKIARVTQLAPGRHSYLVVGKRTHLDQPDCVLFDYGPIYRQASTPKTLPELPTRMANSLAADRVAILDSRGLQLYDREVWHTPNLLDLPQTVMNWIEAAKFDQVEKVLEIIATQTRLGFGYTPEELRANIIDALGVNWRYIETEEKYPELEKSLNEWRKGGSQLAIVSSGARHSSMAWHYRGNGWADSVGQSGWAGFEKHLKLAVEEMDSAIAMGDAPLLAISKRIAAGLHLGENILAMNALCREACERFPGEVNPHSSLVLHMLPKWGGNVGESLNYILSASKIYEPDYADLLYFRLFMVRLQLDPLSQEDNEAEYIDFRRLKNGLATYRNAGLTLDEGIYQLVGRMGQFPNGDPIVNDALHHLMTHSAAPMTSMTEGHLQRFGNWLHARAEELRQRDR